MSYEGFVRYLCERGHQRVVDCYEPFPEACDECGAAIAWRRHVDETNGYDASTDPPLEVLESEVTAMCNLGHAHIIQEARYKVPA